MGLLKNLRNFDFFGEPIQFSLKSHHNQTSVLSAFLSLLFLLSFTLIAFTGFTDLLLKTHLTTDTTDIYNLSPPSMNLPLKLLFSFSDPILNSATYFKIELVQSLYKRDALGTVTKTKQVKALRNCDFESFDESLKPALQVLTSNLSAFLCLSSENFRIKGKYASEAFEFFNIKIAKCENSTSIRCVSEEELKAIFVRNGNKIYLNVFISNNIIDINNIHSYVTTFLDDRIYVLLDLSYYKEKNYYFTLNEVFTDSSIFRTNSFEKELKTYTFENIYDESAVILDRSDAGPRYANIFFRSNFLSKKHTRKVEKIEDFLGYMGGFWSALFVIFSRIGRRYNREKFLMKIAKNLYYFPQELPPNPKPTTNLELKETQRRFFAKNEEKTTKKGGFFEANSLRRKLEKYSDFSKNLKLFQKAKDFFSQLSVRSFFKTFALQRKIKRKALFTMKKDLDLIHLLGKIKEIDKLKEILLDKNQKKLFEFIPKSRILLENDDHFKTNRASMLFMLRASQTTRILRKESIKDYRINDFLSLYSSYMSMLEEKDEKNREINRKIIGTLDPELVRIFKGESETRISKFANMKKGAVTKIFESNCSSAEK